MELWIRSQDKENLVKIEHIYYYDGYDPIDEYDGFTTHEIWANKEEIELGKYKTKERCIEIIDEIQKLLLSATPKNAFVVLKNVQFDSYEEVKEYIERARIDNFLGYYSVYDSIGEKGSIQFLQPNVLVYEMPKE